MGPFQIVLLCGELQLVMRMLQQVLSERKRCNPTVITYSAVMLLPEAFYSTK